ncbi:MAG: HD domain-containing phosphohydrolase [Vulcanimicrobiota bacterium]
MKTVADRVDALPGPAVAFSLRPLEKVEKVLTLATGLSLAVITRDGSASAHFSHPEDLLHPRLVAHPHRLVAEVASDDEGFRLVPGVGRLSYLVHAVVLEGKRVAYVIGGPVWETPPKLEDIEALAERLDVTPEQIKEALACHPAPIPLDMARVKDMMVSLAELAAQTIQDQNQQARNMSTLAALYEVGTAISSTIRLEEVLKKVLDQAISLLQAENGSLMLLDEVRSELKMLVAQGLDEQIVTTTRVTLGEGISGWVAQEGQARLLRKGIKDKDSTSSKPVSQMESAMCVPLKVKDRCLGVLNLSGRRDGGDFSDEDLKILTVLASHAASAIDNAQLYEQVKRQVSELEALYRLGTVLNSSLSLEQILPAVLDQTLALLGAQAASVMLLDEASGELSIRLARGLSEDIVSKTRVRLGHRVSGKVAERGKPILISRANSEDNDSSLCVPLLTNNKVVGVLNIRTKQDGSDFTQQDLGLASQLASVAAVAIENAGLHDELHNLFLSAISALANSIDARDPYTKGHSERVTAYSVMISETMGLSAEAIDDIRYAALLHDIGKIRIRDHILHKPGRLTDEEFAEMKRHPQYGVEIMRPVKAFERILPSMLHHHERYAGGGYPAGLIGEDIPLGARIMCVADCFDAMTSDRPYRKGMPIDAAIEELQRNSGTQFDPRAVEVFVELVSQGRVVPILEAYRSRISRLQSRSAP